jgi:lipopolysaccharide export system protein LptA
VVSTKDQLTRLPSAADMRPNGPVTIGANRAELVQGNSAVYVGSVTMDSDTLKMDGDRLELNRFSDGQYTAKFTGSPVHMSHASTGPDNPPVSAHAKVMNYDSRAGLIDLEGDAELTRGSDKTTADKIRYYLADQRYEASGSDGGNGRVTIVIPQLPASSGASAPTTGAPNAAPAPTAAAPSVVIPAPAPAGAAPPTGSKP